MQKIFKRKNNILKSIINDVILRKNLLNKNNGDINAVDQEITTYTIRRIHYLK